MGVVFSACAGAFVPFTWSSCMSRIVSESRATLWLAVPIILGQVCQVLMGVIDSLMIGQVGTVPLAASAFANSAFFFFYVSGLGLCMPVAVLVSRAHGEGRPAECAQWLRHGVVVTFATGVTIALAMECLGTQLGRMGQPPEVVAQSQPFFSLIAWSLIPAMVFQGVRQFSESVGRPWLPMGLMLAGVALNAALNWVLIYGHWGAPAMGLAGAGVATLVARCVELVALYVVLRMDTALRPNWPARWWSPLEMARLKALLHIGVPAAGQLFFEVGAFSAAAWMMGLLGTVPLAAHQIALSCAGSTFTVPMGLSLAAGMRVSQAIGAGRRDTVRSIGYGSLGIAWLAMGFFALVFLLMGTSIAGLFVDDGSVVALAGRLLAVAGLFQLFDGTQVVGAGLLRGMSDMRVPTLITFVAYWVVMIPLAYWWGVIGHDPLGVWGALVFGLGISAVLLAWRFHRKTRGLSAAFAPLTS